MAREAFAAPTLQHLLGLAPCFVIVAAHSRNDRQAGSRQQFQVLGPEFAGQLDRLGRGRHELDRLAANRRALRRARRLTDSPVVELSRAVAIAEAEGPEAGLAIVDGLALDGYHYLHSIRGELLRRLGRVDEARDAYTTALGLVHDEAERRLLMRRQAAVRPVAS